MASDTVVLTQCRVEYKVYPLDEEHTLQNLELNLRNAVQVMSLPHCQKCSEGPSGRLCSGRAWHARPAELTISESRFAESSLSYRPDPKLTSTSLSLIFYHCHVPRDRAAVDTPPPTRILPTATPAPTAPSPTGTRAK